MGEHGRKPARRQPAPGAFSSRGASRGARTRPSAAPGKPKNSGREDKAGITPNRSRGFAGGTRPYDYSLYESEPATPEYMARLFARHSLPVSPEQLNRFWKLYDLLRRHNARLDLTRIMGIEATVLKHFVDSAIILRWFEPSGPVLDIGSGPGFPGLPLAIMRPGCRFMLAESRAKRMAFLREAATALNLGNVSFFPRSVREDSPLGEEFGQPVGDIVTRAFESADGTLDRVLPFISPGRSAVFLKGPDCESEISRALEKFAGVYELADDVGYVLPGSDQRRRLVVFRKLPLRAG